MIYVLRKSKSLDFICFDKTLEGLKKKINRCYWNAKGMSSSGSDYTKEDYMIGKVISEIHISDLETSQISDNKDCTTTQSEIVPSKFECHNCGNNAHCHLFVEQYEGDINGMIKCKWHSNFV